MVNKRPPRTLRAVDQAFWNYCEKGELRLQQCDDCHHITWPAAEYCEACQSSGLTWTKMSGKGKVISWCTFHQDYYRGVLPTPWDTIVVELEEGVLFLSNPEGFDNQSATLDMPVRVDFIDCEDTKGTFKLPVFAQD